MYFDVYIWKQLFSNIFIVTLGIKATDITVYV